MNTSRTMAFSKKNTKKPHWQAIWAAHLKTLKPFLNLYINMNMLPYCDPLSEIGTSAAPYRQYRLWRNFELCSALCVISGNSHCLWPFDKIVRICNNVFVARFCLGKRPNVVNAPLSPQFFNHWNRMQLSTRLLLNGYIGFLTLLAG